MDNQKGIPRYMRAKKRLREAIASGEFVGKLSAEKHLAEDLGVSYMTLRRAVGELVDEGLLKREMGRGTFVVEQGELTVVKGTIVIAVDPDNAQGFQNPFFMPIFEAIQLRAQLLGYATLVTSDLFNTLETHRNKLSGLICTAVGQRSEFLNAVGDVPTVLLNNWAKPVVLPTIKTDQGNAALLGVRYLQGLGHKQIAYIGADLDVETSLLRFQGYQEAMGNRHIEDSALVEKGNWTFDGGFQAMNKLLDKSADLSAVFCVNDLTALGAIKALHGRGLKVPHDFSVLGFGDIDQAVQSIPSLSTIHLPKQKMGEAAFDALLDIIEGRSTSLNKKIFKSSLVKRETCAGTVHAKRTGEQI